MVEVSTAIVPVVVVIGAAAEGVVLVVLEMIVLVVVVVMIAVEIAKVVDVANISSRRGNNESSIASGSTKDISHDVSRLSVWLKDF